MSDGPPATAAVTLVNALPTLSGVHLAPATAYENSVLGVVVKGADDVDVGTLGVNPTWLVKDAAVVGAACDILRGAHFDQGAVVQGTVTPDEGRGVGETLPRRPQRGHCRALLRLTLAPFGRWSISADELRLRCTIGSARPGARAPARDRIGTTCWTPIWGVCRWPQGGLRGSSGGGGGGGHKVEGAREARPSTSPLAAAPLMPLELPCAPTFRSSRTEHRPPLGRRGCAR